MENINGLLNIRLHACERLLERLSVRLHVRLIDRLHTRLLTRLHDTDTLNN